MKSLDLIIADYNIRLEAADGFEFAADKRFGNFVSQHDYGLNGDLLRILVHKGDKSIPPGAKKIYNAEFSDDERIPGDNPDFWSIWKHGDEHYLKLSFPSHPSGKAILKFSLVSSEWELWTDQFTKSFEPLDYPLDSLILYYLTVINNDIMIHASGVEYNGRGYLFSGVSGKGKTTIARLWDNKGGKVIHDDRLIIRRNGGKFQLYNTPVYNDDAPRSSGLNGIYIIGHGAENIIQPVKGAEAVSLIMANCIQQNWERNIIRGLLESITDLCRNIPVYRLSFRPDESVIDYLIKNE
jgi:hypothetical protein